MELGVTGSRTPGRGVAHYPPKDASMATPRTSTSGNEGAETQHPEVAPESLSPLPVLFQPPLSSRSRRQHGESGTQAFQW